MGQYYLPTIFKKSDNIAQAFGDEAETPIKATAVASLYSHDFKETYTGWNGQKFKSGIGLKLMEHSYIGNQLCRAMEYLLSTEYAGCPVVWGGDYGDDVFVSENPQNGESETINAYGLGTSLTNATFAKLPAKRKWRNKWNRYLINHDTHEYVKIPQMKKDKWQIHPLPLLTANGNGRGGGDFRGEDERIGMWCGHHLSVANELPNDAIYREIDGVFHEEE